MEVCQRRHLCTSSKGHPNTDLRHFRCHSGRLWKPSNYRVPGDAAEDAAAAFLRTTWLTECRGNLVPDDSGRMLRHKAQGSEPQGPSPDCVSSRTKSPASSGHREVCPTWRKHRLDISSLHPGFSMCGAGLFGLKVGKKNTSG